MNAGYGTSVKVERSTFDTTPAVWVFVRNSPNGPVKGALNLNRNQAIDLMVQLKKFVNEAGA